MRDKNNIFNRVELVLGIDEGEAFIVADDASGAVWKLMRGMGPRPPNLTDKEWWTITSELRTMSAEELLELINHPEMIQNVDESRQNGVFCALNSTIAGISIQIITALFLAASSAASLLFSALSEINLKVGTIAPLITLALGTILFGYNCFKLGAYVVANKEGLI